MSHPVLVGNVYVNFTIADTYIEVEASVDTVDRTGVEMEALMAVTVAALTIYDMCKSIDRTMTIEAGRALGEVRGPLGHAGVATSSARSAERRRRRSSGAVRRCGASRYPRGDERRLMSSIRGGVEQSRERLIALVLLLQRAWPTIAPLTQEEIVRDLKIDEYPVSAKGPQKIPAYEGNEGAVRQKFERDKARIRELGFEIETVVRDRRRRWLPDRSRRAGTPR